MIAATSYVKFEPNIPVEVTVQSESYRPEQDLVEYVLADGRAMRLSNPVAAKINLLEIQPGESFCICKRWNGDLQQPCRWDIWLTQESERARAKAEEPGLVQQLRQSLAMVNERAAQVGDVPPTPDHGGWNGSGSQEAANLVAQRIVAELRGRPSPSESAIADPKPSIKMDTAAPAPLATSAVGGGSPASPDAGRRSPFPDPPPSTGTRGPQAVPIAVKRRAPAPAVQRIPINVAFKELLLSTTQTLKDAGVMWAPEQVQKTVVSMLITATQNQWVGPWERAEGGEEDAPF